MALAQSNDDPDPITPWLVSLGQKLWSGTVSARAGPYRRSRLTVDPFEVGRWVDAIVDTGLSPLVVHRANLMLDRKLQQNNPLTQWARNVDTLLDGVIVWENLFALGQQNELGFRVSLNVAAILEDDIDARIEAQERIHALYKLRSKIVHGGSVEVLPTDAEEVRKLTVQVLRRLLSIYPDLIGMRNQALYLKLLSS